jgi:phosphatidate cytidylyltransferase
MHLKRWITAVVLLPLLFFLLLKGTPIAFSVLVALVTLLGLKEYFTIISGAGTKIPLTVSIPAYGMGLAVIWAAHTGGAGAALAMVALNLVLLALVVVLQFSPDSSILDAARKEIQGIVYLPMFLSFLVLIRNSDQGAVWIIWTFLIIAASDTGAYYCGTYFGKRPLSPRVSPNKTVEGSAAGIVSAVVIGLCFSQLFVSGISPVQAILFSTIAAAAGQVGDLFESALKRRGGIKDSGSILPGHGGILDRIDGLIFALPIAFAFKTLL